MNFNLIFLFKNLYSRLDPWWRLDNTSASRFLGDFFVCEAQLMIQVITSLWYAAVSFFLKVDACTAHQFWDGSTQGAGSAVLDGAVDGVCPAAIWRLNLRSALQGFGWPRWLGDFHTCLGVKALGWFPGDSAIPIYSLLWLAFEAVFGKGMIFGHGCGYGEVSWQDLHHELFYFAMGAVDRNGNPLSGSLRWQWKIHGSFVECELFPLL